jgi:hypothetical protein
VSIPTDTLIPQSPAPCEQLEALCKRLNLAHTRRIYKQVAAQAEKESWSYGDFLALLQAEEVARRKQTRPEALHPRKFAAREGSSLAGHRTPLVAAGSGRPGKRYLKRQQLLDLGEPAYLYLTAAPDPADPRPGGFAARHARGAQGGVFRASYVERFLPPSAKRERLPGGAEKGGEAGNGDIPPVEGL